MKKLFLVWIKNKEDGWSEGRYIPCHRWEEVTEVIQGIDKEWEEYYIEECY